MNANLLCVVLTAMQAAAPGPEQLLVVARDGSDSALVAEVRKRPDDVREAFRQLLARSALVDAERLASAYATAWNDTFLVTQVAKFREWSPIQQRTKIVVDSLRRAGNDALGSAGIPAAVRLWRRSVRTAFTIADTAGVAAGLGNIGRGFYEQGALDSADSYWLRSQDLAQRIGDQRTAANAIGNRASVRKDLGALRQAESLYARAGVIRTRIGDTRGLAADENNRGLIAQTLGDFAGARRSFENALSANRSASRRTAAAANLINLGNLDAAVGNGVAAEAQYAEARELYEADGDRRGVAEAWHDIGLMRSSRGDYPNAIAALKSALTTYAGVGTTAEISSVRRDLADVRAAMGDLPAAIRELDRAATSVGPGTEQLGLRARLALTRADLETQLNHSTNADRFYRQAVSLYRQAEDASGEAEALQGRGYLLLMGDDFAQAREVLQQSLRAQALADPRSRARTRLLIGFASQETGDTRGARVAMNLALDTLRAANDVVGQAAALSALGDLEARAGIGLTAESLYHRGLELLRTTEAPSVAWQLHAGLAEALEARGALADASAELRASAAEVERVAARLPLEQRRVGYLADKWSVYAQLALLERRRGHLDDAFAASERLRAREMLDLLARGRVAWRGRAPPGDTAALQEQELRFRITDLTRRLEASQASTSALRERGTGVDATIQEALAQAQADYEELLVRVQSADPRYSRLISGHVSPLRDVARQLSPDEALLEYLVTDSTTLVFVVTTDSAAVMDLQIGHHELAGLVDFARGALTRPARRNGSNGPSWRAPLQRLYQELIEPIETSGMLHGKQSLIIAPHAELHYLPFATLRRSTAPHLFLVEQYVVTTVPSASVWLELRHRGETAAGTGVLALAPRVDALPASRDEVEAVRRSFGGAGVVRTAIGTQATKRFLRTTLADQRIVHFATYGVLNKHNPLFSFVELAADSEAGADGRLEVHDVFSLDLHARLVVLSACQTALGSGSLADVPAGDEWVGLTEGFLYAGAARVMATLWPVEDRSTATLMEQFYHELAAGAPEGDALARAQRLALRNPATADPFYWAGFTLSGGP